MTLDEDDTLFWSSFFMSMEGQRNSVGSGSTAPLTSLIWPGILVKLAVSASGRMKIDINTSRKANSLNKSV